MIKYIVRDLVCDWGICSVDDLGKEELVDVCNSKANAELICEILNTDLMKDGKYTIWKDKKISDLETKLAEKEKEITQRLVIQERDYNQDKISFALEQLEQLKHDIWTDQQDCGWLDEQVDIYFLTETIDNQIKRLTHQEDKGE